MIYLVSKQQRLFNSTFYTIINAEQALNIIKKIFTGRIGPNKTIQYGFIKDLEGTSDIQVQKETEEINKVIGDKEIELMGKSILKATMDKPEIEDILQCSLNLHKKETKLGEDKIYFGCYCKVEVLYKGKDTDDIILLNDDIYLSKEQELIGCNRQLQ